MRDWWRHAWAIARKDLTIELRSRTALVSTLVFTVLVLLVFNFGRDPTATSALDLAPGILFTTFTFAAMLALNRGFRLELENQALDGILLSPIDRRSLYGGKLIANLAFVGLVEVIAVPLFVLFFDVSLGPILAPFVCLVALASVGLVAVGTLFSTMVIRTRYADLLLPVLQLPFSIPPLVLAVLATAQLFAGRPLREVSGDLRLLAAYDLVFVFLATLLFPATVQE